MATSGVQVREMVGSNQFAKRREIFNKYDSVFLPQNNGTHPRHSETYGRPVLLGNHDNSTSTFPRHTYSSFRDPRSNTVDYRQRKWSDVQNPEYLEDGIIVRDKSNGDLPRSHSSSDYSQNLRRQRLSKLRAEFLASNLHSPEEGPKSFDRYGTRASLPAQRSSQYTGVAHIYKFSFAEPFSTPPAIRKIVFDFGKLINAEDQNDDDKKECVNDTDHEVLDSTVEETELSSTDVTDDFAAETAPASKKRPSITQINDISYDENVKERFEKLRNEYAPYVPPTNILESLPPTKPRIVNVIPKQNSSIQLQTDNTNTDGATVQILGGEANPANENEVASNNSNTTATQIGYVPSHQRSPSDFTKDSSRPTQHQRRNTEDNSNKNMKIPKAKKRNIFQRLFLKNKKEK